MPGIEYRVIEAKNLEIFRREVVQEGMQRRDGRHVPARWVPMGIFMQSWKRRRKRRRAACQSQQNAKAKQIEKEAEGPASPATADSSKFDPARPTRLDPPRNPHRNRRFKREEVLFEVNRIGKGSKKEMNNGNAIGSAAA